MKTSLKKFLEGRISLFNDDLCCLCSSVEQDDIYDPNDAAISCIYDEEDGCWFSTVLDDGTSCIS